MPPRDFVALAVSRTPTQPTQLSSCCASLDARPSAVEPGPRRAVRTMVLRVAVLALAVECVDRLRISRIAWMLGEIGVTLLAEARPRDLQQEVIDRAVRIVAVQAIVAHRGMLPQERAALLRVTLVAIVVDGGLIQKSLAVGAMRIVAAGARHLAFANRHVRRAPNFRALVLVTLETGVRLGQLGQLELGRHVGHDGVAIGAGESARLMRTAAPQRAFSLLLALRADCVVVLCRTGRIVRAEGDHSADSTAAASGHVRRARAMTGFAPRLLLGIARVLQEDLAHHGLTEPSALVRMAARTDLRPYIGRIIGVYGLCRLDRLLCGLRRFRLRGFGEQKPVAFRRRRVVSSDLAHEVAQRQIGLVVGWGGVMR